MILKGKLTYLSGTAALLAGLAELLNCTVGFIGGSPCDVSGAIEKIGMGLGLIGLRRAM